MQGITHILLGFDHLLFVLALVLLVQGTRRLIATITAFTVAHSLTLAGATLGWVNVPGPPVEASIALSIVFVASEIVHRRQGRTSLTQRYPWMVAFTFGLLGGRRFRTTALALDVYGGPGFAHQGTYTSVLETPQTGRIVHEKSAGLLFRASAATRLVFRPDALVRSFLGIDLDVGERGDSSSSPPEMPRLPLWTLGISLGATVGTR